MSVELHVPRPSPSRWDYRRVANEPGLKPRPCPASEERLARVEALQRAVALGTYRPDLGRLAVSLLRAASRGELRLRRTQ